MQRFGKEAWGVARLTYATSPADAWSASAVSNVSNCVASHGKSDRREDSVRLTAHVSRTSPASALRRDASQRLGLSHLGSGSADSDKRLSSRITRHSPRITHYALRTTPQPPNPGGRSP